MTSPNIPNFSQPGTTSTGAMIGAVPNAPGGNAYTPTALNNQRTVATFPTLAPPPMNTAVYAPDVNIYIAHDGIQYDLSRDIVRGQLVRRENSVASLFSTLSNQNLKYTSGAMPLARMDRITCWLTRVTRIQSFSGYLDTIPWMQAYPGTVNIRATCTIKRLLHTWWNPALPASLGFFDQMGPDYGTSGDGQGGSWDGGMSDILRNILQQVGGWLPETIHVQNFPSAFITFLNNYFVESNMTANNSAQVSYYSSLVLGSDTSPGPMAAVGYQASDPVGTAVTATNADTEFYLSQIVTAVDARGMGPIVNTTSNDQVLSHATDILEGAKAAGGMDSQQLAQDVSQAGQQLGTYVSNRTAQNQNSDAAILALACAMVESGGGTPNLMMYANQSDPPTLTFFHNALSFDGTSSGLFQQQNNGSWGTPEQRMNPYASAGMFLDALQSKTGWRNMDPGQAIWQVQQSAPAAIAKYSAAIPVATQLVQTYRKAQQGATNAANSAITNIPGAGALSGLTGGGTNALGSIGAQTLNNATNSPISTAAGAISAGRPVPDSEGAINAAYSMYLTPYLETSEGMDCCVAGDTMVYGPCGAKPITELKSGDLVYSKDGDRLVVRRVLAQRWTADQETFKVRTRNRSVVGSANHPFLRMCIESGRGGALSMAWTRIDELRAGDFIVTPKDLAQESDDVEYFLPDGTHAMNASKALREWVAGGDFTITRVLSVEPQGVQPTYDIEVDGSHNFIADGLVVHNSHLVQLSFGAIGISLPRTTYQQKGSVPTVYPYSAAQRGDILQTNGGGHTGIYLGGGQWIQTGGPTGTPGRIESINPASCYWVGRACQNGGIDPAAPFTPVQIVNGLPVSGTIPGVGIPPGTGTGGVLGGGGGSMSGSEPIARNLFSYIFQPANYASALAEILTGEKAFIDDQPLIQIVRALCQASMRNFQSAPNGDFIAYYPDYFGIDGKPAVLNLEDVELKDCHIDLSDDPLTTHVYIEGDMTQIGEANSAIGWLGTAGVATVENPFLYQMLIQAAPGDVAADMSPELLMMRFGVRPYKDSYNLAANAGLEFLLACMTFMGKWAAQYETDIGLTFMPELMPGMRINLAGHNLQVYCSAVTHVFDWERGFSTQATVSAASNPNAARSIYSSLPGFLNPVSTVMGNANQNTSGQPASNGFQAPLAGGLLDMPAGSLVNQGGPMTSFQPPTTGAAANPGSTPTVGGG